MLRALVVVHGKGAVKRTDIVYVDRRGFLQREKYILLHLDRRVVELTPGEYGNTTAEFFRTYGGFGNLGDDRLGQIVIPYRGRRRSIRGICRGIVSDEAF